MNTTTSHTDLTITTTSLVNATTAPAMLKQTRAMAAAMAMAFPMLASAHDLVLIPENTGALTVRFGHPGDWQPADKERLLDLQVQGDGDAARRFEAKTLKGHGLDLQVAAVAAAGKAALVTARYDNGLWVTVPDAAGKPVHFNSTKAMVPGATTTMAAIKFAKGLYGSADDATVYKRESNQLIELIPQRNPANVKPGETLAVMVRFDGKPLADAGVEVTDSAVKTVEGQAKFTTDANGVAQVPIKRGGLNVISVDYERPNDGSFGAAWKTLPVDRVVMIATYAFRVR